MRVRRSFLSILASLFLLLIVPRVAHAETKILTNEATYTMGDGETPSFAEAMALQKAKQMTLEEAGTYVESYTKTQNLDLTTDEVQTIAGGVLQVEVLEKKRSLVGDGLQFFIKIKATVTTDKMEELAQRIKGKNVAEEYKKLQEDYARLAKEIEIWKQVIARTPPGPEREAAVDQMQKREKEFARSQTRETNLFQRLFSGRELFSEAVKQSSWIKSARESVNSLFQWLVTNGYRLSHGKPSLSTSLKRPGRVSVTIPVSISLTPAAKARLTEVVEQLGGDSAVLKATTSVRRCGKDTDGRLPSGAKPVILSGDHELQELFLGLVTSQFLELQAVKEDGTILVQESLESIPQRVVKRVCTDGTIKQSHRTEKNSWHLRTAAADYTPPRTPLFATRPPTLEEQYPGFSDIITRHRDAGKSEADILRTIEAEKNGLARKLSPEQVGEVSAGCRILSEAYKDARMREDFLASSAIFGALESRRGGGLGFSPGKFYDNLSKQEELSRPLKELQDRELDRIAKQPLQRPCVQDQDKDVPSQVFLLDEEAVEAAFVLDLPLELIEAIQDFQARVTLKAAPNIAE
jgi:hypothetical protein